MKLIGTLVVGILTSFFYFPFEFSFLPGINTKMMMAVPGALILGWQMVSTQSVRFSGEFLGSVIFALIFSLAGFYSIDYNHTDDTSYAYYIVSMLVWFGAAYAVVNLMAFLHGYISVRLFCNYLTAVCVAQCALALIIEFSLPAKTFVDTHILMENEFLNEVNRLYGIGASLDVAGVRFAVALVLISAALSADDLFRRSRQGFFVYILAFGIISVVGNMIARTASLGMIIGIAYMIYKMGPWEQELKMSRIKLWGWLLGGIIILLVVGIALYHNIPEVKKLMRFAFEGFFNWVETGKWETSSTNKLMKAMVVFPDNLKTWIIGDGYFVDPLTGGFYMRTDIGYLRLIFYSGLIGLFAFSAFFVYQTAVLSHRFKEYRDLFRLLLIVVFVNWLKVSTDIFLIYAVFLSMSMPYVYNRRYINPNAIEQ